jgi:hypothetical protein
LPVQLLPPQVLPLLPQQQAQQQEPPPAELLVEPVADHQVALLATAMPVADLKNLVMPKVKAKTNLNH